MAKNWQTMNNIMMYYLWIDLESINCKATLSVVVDPLLVII